MSKKGIDIKGSIAQIMMSVRKEREEWIKAHPNYCQACNGWGIFYEPSTQWEPEDSYPCAKCVDEEKCPHCGEAITEVRRAGSKTVSGGWESYLECPACGWNEETSAGMPWVDEQEQPSKPATDDITVTVTIVLKAVNLNAAHDGLNDIFRRNFDFVRDWKYAE